MTLYTLLVGDVLEQLATLPDNSVHCAVTSPPYWGLRSYLPAGHADKVLELGAERTPQEYVAAMVRVFAELRRVLRPDGTLWLNIGDSYAMSSVRGNSDFSHTSRGAHYETSGILNTSRSIPTGLKPKDLCMIPARVALALQDDGWWLRSHIVWAKRAPMPESVTDRPTSAWESIFLLTKSARYFYDAEAVKESAAATPVGATGIPFGGVKHANGNGNPTYFGNEYTSTGTRNQRNVWHLSPEPYSEAHFATFPTEIPRRAILAGTSAHGVCSACGAPWRRVVERGEPDKETTRGKQDWTAVTGQRDSRGGLPHRDTETLGWQPTCTCGAGTVPATVLDPFAGSGTTLAVALSLGRHAIGIELNPEYAELAHKRITTTQPAMIGL